MRYGFAVAEKDPYELLGVPRDASDARIRAAYELEVNRATRDGAIRYAAELSTAYDTIANAKRRALYERHGFAAIRERSPGTAPPPPPRDWQATGLHAPAPVHRSRRGVKAAAIFIFAVGLAAWFIGATQHAPASKNPGRPTQGVIEIQREHQVLCQPTSGQGYVYSEPVTNQPHCDNGATPVIKGPN